MAQKKQKRATGMRREGLSPPASKPESAFGHSETTGDAWHAQSPPRLAAPERELTRRDMLPILALGLLVAVSYFPATQAGFVWDDVILTGSKAVQDWAGLWQLWFSPGDTYVPENTHEGHYWPLLYSTFWLEHKLWGFAVHPVHVEAVVWIIARKDLLSTLFYLTAVATWIRFMEDPRPGRYVLALTLFVAGLLCKSIIVTLPVGLLILHWWKQDLSASDVPLARGGHDTSIVLLRLLPFFLVGLAIAFADMSFYQTKENISFTYSVVERVLIATHSLWFYAGKLLWPVELAVIYPHWITAPADLLAWGYIVAAGAVVVLFWLLRDRIGRGPLAGGLFFAVTLSPVLGFVDYGYMQFSFVADRYQYLASIGPIAVLIGVAAHAANRLSVIWQRCLWSIAFAALAFLGSLTWDQSGIYRDEVTFYRHVIALNPQARAAQLNLGGSLLDENRFEEALAASLVAVEQGADVHKAHFHAARALKELGRLDEAEQHYRLAIESNPRYTKALRNLSRLFIEQERFEEALAVGRDAIRQEPDSAKAHFHAGRALAGLSRFDEAEQSYRRTLDIDPRYAGNLWNLMESLIQEERYEHALAASRVAPSSPYVLDALARWRFGQQRYEEALALYQRLAEIEPDRANVYSDMGIVLYQLDRIDEALESFDRALSLDPTLETARGNREQVLKNLEQRGQ